MDFRSFILGFIVCMVSDVVFSLAEFLLQRSFYYRKKQRESK